METLRVCLDFLLKSLLSPFGYLCLLWGMILQFLIFWSTKEKLMRWMLPMIFGGGIVAFAALILLTESFFSLLAIALLPYLILVLMGTLAGSALYKLYQLNRKDSD
jgi:hypothetical protein